MDVRWRESPEKALRDGPQRLAREPDSKPPELAGAGVAEAGRPPP